MRVEFRWREVNEYQTTVTLDPEAVRAAGLDPDSAGDVQSYLEHHEQIWVEQVDDFNAAHRAVLERDVTSVTEIDAKSGVLT